MFPIVLMMHKKRVRWADMETTHTVIQPFHKGGYVPQYELPSDWNCFWWGVRNSLGNLLNRT